MQVDVGIIGGTGIGDRLLGFGGQALHVPTSAGILRGRRLEIDGTSLFLVGRHSAGHKVPPHKVNYRAMALGMKALGVKACISSAAVGSLRCDWLPGTFVSCSDFSDFTGRYPTLFDRAVVHTDFSEPFAPSARMAIVHAAADLGENIHDAGIYLGANGPRFESPKEIDLYKFLGGDIIGMTAVSEAILMHEAGIPYGCLAIVTNLAAGMTASPITHGEVLDEMDRSGDRAVKILIRAAHRLAGKA